MTGPVGVQERAASDGGGGCFGSLPWLGSRVFFQRLRAIFRGSRPALFHHRASFPERCSSRWCNRQSGTEYSSLTFRPRARFWAKRRWWGSEGRRPQIRQDCDATNFRCALSRYRRTSPIGSTLLSMPTGSPRRAAGTAPLLLRRPDAPVRRLAGDEGAACGAAISTSFAEADRRVNRVRDHAAPAPRELDPQRILHLGPQFPTEVPHARAARRANRHR
jgi:hypothetical protein